MADFVATIPVAVILNQDAVLLAWPALCAIAIDGVSSIPNPPTVPIPNPQSFNPQSLQSSIPPIVQSPIAGSQGPTATHQPPSRRKPAAKRRSPATNVVASSSRIGEDQPAGHFTHDFNFEVNPDPPFEYLLGKQDGVVQPSIEVEWESGFAQADSRDRNPASAASIRGDSFGFYIAGHRRRDVIWNWPTANDWVHVEGIWIYDRGHRDPVKTEIHPPRFVAVKRDLPTYSSRNRICPDNSFLPRGPTSSRTAMATSSGTTNDCMISHNR